jgi:DNA modification methylase
LPDFFIRLLTNRGDLVLDPFVGSGTTSVVSRRLGRRSIGIELRADHVDLARRRLEGSDAVGSTHRRAS